jgi:hypothetical protein
VSCARPSQLDAAALSVEDTTRRKACHRAMDQEGEGVALVHDPLFLPVDRLGRPLSLTGRSRSTTRAASVQQLVENEARTDGG